MASLMEGNVQIKNIKGWEGVEKIQPTSGKSKTLFLRVMCEKTFPMLIALFRQFTWEMYQFKRSSVSVYFF